MIVREREGGKERRRGGGGGAFGLDSARGSEGREGEREGENRSEEKAHSFAQLESATGGNGPAAAGAKRRPAAAGAWVRRRCKSVLPNAIRTPGANKELTSVTGRDLDRWGIGPPPRLGPNQRTEWMEE